MSSQRASKIVPIRAFVRRVFMVVAVGALIAAVWALSDILLLLFGSISVCGCAACCAAPWRPTYRPPPHRRSAARLSSSFWEPPASPRPRARAQMRGLFTPCRRPPNRLAGHLQVGSVADLIKDGTAASALGGLAARSSPGARRRRARWRRPAGAVRRYLSGDQSQLYRDGLVKLVPPAVQPNVEATLDDAGEALRRWLAGQVIAMLLVGLCTGAGLWLAGVPSPFALGFIAGLAEFVPIIGPIVAAIPAILIASTQDWQTVLLALACS